MAGETCRSMKPPEPPWHLHRRASRLPPLTGIFGTRDPPRLGKAEGSRFAVPAFQAASSPSYPTDHEVVPVPPAIPGFRTGCGSHGRLSTARLGPTAFERVIWALWRLDNLPLARLPPLGWKGKPSRERIGHPSPGNFSTTAFTGCPAFFCHGFIFTGLESHRVPGIFCVRLPGWEPGSHGYFVPGSMTTHNAGGIFGLGFFPSSTGTRKPVPNALRHCPCGSSDLSPLRILASVNCPPAFFCRRHFWP
jgi:hypothetical protein